MNSNILKINEFFAEASTICTTLIIMSYKGYTNEDIIKAVAESKSLTQVLKKLDLIPAGGNFLQLKLNIAKLELDTSHFTGQLWSKGETLKDYQEYSRPTHLKPKLIKEKGHKCEVCLLETWLDKPITLEIHHLDGSRVNNAFENLQLLCPNCHSQTDSWRRAKPKDKKVKEKELKEKVYNYCTNCKKEISKKATTCKSCTPKTNKIEWPSVEELLEMLKTTSKVQLAKKLGVSDNAIKKRLERHA